MKSWNSRSVRSGILALLIVVTSIGGAEEFSNPIVDIRFDGPYGQVIPSHGDEWAPTWGKDDVLYTGNDDGNSFGGVPNNTMTFGKLEGRSPYTLKGTTINEMAEYQERSLGPEVSGWKSLDTLKVKGNYYRFSTCETSAGSICISTSIDGRSWTQGVSVFERSRVGQVRFIVWSKQRETALVLKPLEYAYAAAYVGIVDGEDHYLIARAPLAKLPNVTMADWSFQQNDYTWGDLKSAAPRSSNGKVGPDGANWKTTNTYSVDGVLYMFVMRCTYPAQSSDPKRRHVWRHSSIIKSTDDGRTWTRSPQENYAKPMFPGQRFGTPYFVWYGKDGAASVDNADHYVYAISNNGFFENGDDYVLGRVPRSKLANLSGADWAFYTKGDGMKDGTWSAKLEDAGSILSNPGRSGMTGMTYIPHLRRYVVVTWHYSQENFEAGIAAKDLSTMIEFFDAPKPWGSWTKVKSYETGKLGWYVPVVGQRFQQASGANAVTAFLYPTGFSTKPEGGLDFELYKFNYIPITLSTRPLAHKDPAYVGGQ